MPSNKQVTLASRPKGLPCESDFKIIQTPIPEPGEGQVLVRALYISVDPYIRGMISGVKSYIAPVEIGQVVYGGMVGEIVISHNPNFSVGDIVEGNLGWQEYAISSGHGLRKVDPSLAPVSTALGVLGMPGMTAYFGLLDIGQPRAGETVGRFRRGGSGGIAGGSNREDQGMHGGRHRGSR